jgi:hypothetical protein
MEINPMSTKALMLAGVAAALMTLGSAGGGFAEVLNYSVDLTGAAEVPPNTSAGTGKVEATYDTDSKAFTWNITYSGLSGDATAAHFHGPAAAGANAGPVIPIEGSLASPIAGNATLTDAQAADLQAGMWYFNLHTAQFPDGELRGQLTR